MSQRQAKTGDAQPAELSRKEIIKVYFDLKRLSPKWSHLTRRIISGEKTYIDTDWNLNGVKMCIDHLNNSFNCKITYRVAGPKVYRIEQAVCCIKQDGGLRVKHRGKWSSIFTAVNPPLHRVGVYFTSTVECRVYAVELSGASKEASDLRRRKSEYKKL